MGWYNIKKHLKTKKKFKINVKAEKMFSLIHWSCSTLAKPSAANKLTKTYSVSHCKLNTY